MLVYHPKMTLTFKRTLSNSTQQIIKKKSYLNMQEIKQKDRKYVYIRVTFLISIFPFALLKVNCRVSVMNTVAENSNQPDM